MYEYEYDEDEGDKQYRELQRALKKQSTPEKMFEEEAAKKKANISNLPSQKFQQLRNDKVKEKKEEDLFGEPKKKGATIFTAWNDNDTMDIDFTTEQVLADKESFEILKERGYQTLIEYPENGKENKRFQEYELQQQQN